MGNTLLCASQVSQNRIRTGNLPMLASYYIQTTKGVNTSTAPFLVSISAYVTFPWSIITAYRPVRPPLAQPMDSENFASGSDRNSCKGQHRTVEGQETDIQCHHRSPGSPCPKRSSQRGHSRRRQRQSGRPFPSIAGGSGCSRGGGSRSRWE